MSKRIAGRAEEEMKEEDGHEEAASPLACDPSLTEVQATPIPPSKLNTACMYHSLLTHIQITQHAQGPLWAAQVLLPL